MVSSYRNYWNLICVSYAKKNILIYQEKIEYNVGSVKSGHMKPAFHIRDAVHIFAMIVLIKTRSQIRNRFAQPEYSFCPPW